MAKNVDFTGAEVRGKIPPTLPIDNNVPIKLHVVLPWSADNVGYIGQSNADINHI